MKTTILGPNAYQSLKVELEPGESFLSEAGKMVRASRSVDVEVTLRRKEGQGLMAGLKRMFSGDSFFFSRYSAGHQPGEVVVSPTLIGNVQVLEPGDDTWYCAGGSFLACHSQVQAVPEWQGMRGLLSGESMVFIKCSGHGFVAVESFGMISPMEVNGEFVVDTGHVVAFQSSLSYEISKPKGAGWLSSFLAGEGLVITFKGHGTVLIQSHNGAAFGSQIGPELPKRRS